MRELSTPNFHAPPEPGNIRPMTTPLAVPTIDIGPFLDGDARVRRATAAQVSAKGCAALCRFDMSACLAHDVLSQLGGIEQIRLKASRNLATQASLTL